MRLLFTGLAIILLACPVSAIILVKPGDVIYMNETLDLSQAASWPDYALAWCRDYSNCLDPDIVIELTEGNIEKYYIDPTVFKYGEWYRWDGEWHRGENALAFVIKSGTRPAVKYNISATPAETVQNPEREGPFSYIIAKGDSPVLSVLLYRRDACHLWIFGNNDKTYNLPMKRGNESYTYAFSSDNTSATDTGKFDGYIACDGRNGWQEISYNGTALTTPYRIVRDIPIKNLPPSEVKKQFDTLPGIIPNFDDKLYPITVTVTVASIDITDVEQDEGNLYLDGKTSWSDGSLITVRLDPEKYVLAQDARTHTWKTIASGEQNAYRKFSVIIPVDRMQLSVGSHQIVSKVEKNGYTSESYYNFKVTDLYVMPTPTPMAKRMIYGKDYEGIPVKITPTPTPVITEVPTPNVTATAIATPNVTTPVTTKTTKAKTTAVPDGTKPIPTIPTEIPCIVSAVGAAIVIRRMIKR